MNDAHQTPAKQFTPPRILALLVVVPLTTFNVAFPLVWKVTVITIPAAIVLLAAVWNSAQTKPGKSTLRILIILNVVAAAICAVIVSQSLSHQRKMEKHVRETQR